MAVIGFMPLCVDKAYGKCVCLSVCVCVCVCAHTYLCGSCLDRFVLCAVVKVGRFLPEAGLSLWCFYVCVVFYVSGSQTGLYVPSGVCQRSVGVHETDSDRKSTRLNSSHT